MARNARRCRTGTRPKLQACVIKLGLCVSEHGRHAPGAAAFDVAEYVEGRYPFGASPATVHTACSGVAKVYQVPRLSDSPGDGPCPDGPHPFGRERRDDGSSQISGVGGAHTEAAARLALYAWNGGGVRGLRDT